MSQLSLYFFGGVVRTVKCTDAHRQRQCTHRCCRVCQDFGFSILAVVSPCVSTVWKTLSLSAALLFRVHRALGENKIQTSVGETIPRRKRANKKNSPEKIVILKVWRRKTNITKDSCLKILFMLLLPIRVFRTLFFSLCF